MTRFDDPDAWPQPLGYVLAPTWTVAALMGCVALMGACLGWAAHALYTGGPMLPITDWVRLFGVSLALWIVALGAMWVVFR